MGLITSDNDWPLMHLKQGEKERRDFLFEEKESAFRKRNAVAVDWALSVTESAVNNGSLVKEIF